MEESVRKKIIEEYKNGKSSLQIVKIVGLSKPTILKVLHKNNLIRKKDRCKSLNILKEGEKFYVTRKCPMCNSEVKTYSKDKIIACRNHFNALKNNCKKCSLKLQVGKGNPFYGKKHSKKSIEKMTKTLTKNPRKFSSSSKPETKIFNIVKDLNYFVIKTKRIHEYICDIFIKDLNLIIEYNGDYWHCNPKKYKPDYIHPHKKKKAEEIWNDDEVRIDNLKKYGYNLEVIWESEFDEQITIQNIIKKYVKN